jgi:hypothetical protein
LEPHDRASPRGKSGLGVFLIRIAPLLGLGVIAALLGYKLAIFIPATGRIYLFVGFLVLLMSMMILDTEPGWNVGFFLVFAMTAGALLYWSGSGTRQVYTWFLFIFLVLISLIGALYLRYRVSRIVVLLYPSAFLYMIGWVGLLFFDLPILFTMVWTMIGFILFTLINTAVLIRGKSNDEEDSPVPIVIELFVVLFNLFWLSGTL